MKRENRLSPTRVLHLALAGVLEDRRTAELMVSIVRRVREARAHAVLLDLGGVHELDDDEINWLVNLATAVRLAGAAPSLAGVSAEAARRLAQSSFHVASLGVHAGAAA